METEEPMDTGDQLFDYERELREAIENIPDDWLFPSELELSQNNSHNEDLYSDPHNNLETPELRNINEIKWFIHWKETMLEEKSSCKSTETNCTPLL